MVGFWEVGSNFFGPDNVLFSQKNRTARECFEARLSSLQEAEEPAREAKSHQRTSFELMT
jgi:hypothetical protein